MEHDSKRSQKTSAPVDFGPLTIKVRLPGDRVVTVSAFCVKCGRRRRIVGQPAPGLQAFVGTGARAGAAFVSWLNPCGHVDTAEALLVEESMQCARPGCVLRASDTFYPYCSATCATCGADCPCWREDG